MVVQQTGGIPPLVIDKTMRTALKSIDLEPNELDVIESILPIIKVENLLYHVIGLNDAWKYKNKYTKLVAVLMHRIAELPKKKLLDYFRDIDFSKLSSVITEQKMIGKLHIPTKDFHILINIINLLNKKENLVRFVDIIKTELSNNKYHKEIYHLPRFDYLNKINNQLVQIGGIPSTMIDIAIKSILKMLNLTGNDKEIIKIIEALLPNIHIENLLQYTISITDIWKYKSNYSEMITDKINIITELSDEKLLDFLKEINYSNVSKILKKNQNKLNISNDEFLMIISILEKLQNEDNLMTIIRLLKSEKLNDVDMISLLSKVNKKLKFKKVNISKPLQKLQKNMDKAFRKNSPPPKTKLRKIIDNLKSKMKFSKEEETKVINIREYMMYFLVFIIIISIISKIIANGSNKTKSKRKSKKSLNK